MLKIIIDKGNYRKFAGNTVLNVNTYKDDLGNGSFQFVVDISFGGYGFFVGAYQDEARAEEVAVEVRDFIADEKLEKYTVPEE